MNQRIFPDVPNYITDVYRFPRDVIGLVISRPTGKGELRMDGHLLCRFYQRTTSFCTDIISVTEVDPKGPFVNLAIRLFPDFSDVAVGECSPLENIKAFAERFGLTLKIGNKSGKFFLSETVPLSDVPDPRNAMTWDNPNGHSFEVFSFINPTPGSLSIAMACCLNMTQYRQWFESH